MQPTEGVISGQGGAGGRCPVFLFFRGAGRGLALPLVLLHFYSRDQDAGVGQVSVAAPQIRAREHEVLGPGHQREVVDRDVALVTILEN